MCSRRHSGSEAETKLPEAGERLPHLLILERVGAEAFTRKGRGNKKVRDVERRTHGTLIRDQAATAFSDTEDSRPEFDMDELRSLGVVLTLEGAPGFPSSWNHLSLRADTNRILARAGCY